MPEYLAPGVYVEEVSFRSKSIEGVPTSTTGFAGMTRYGPVWYPGGPSTSEPRLIGSFTEFESVYGGLEVLHTPTIASQLKKVCGLLAALVAKLNKAHNMEVAIGGVESVDLERLAPFPPSKDRDKAMALVRRRSARIFYMQKQDRELDNYIDAFVDDPNHPLHRYNDPKSVDPANAGKWRPRTESDRWVVEVIQADMVDAEAVKQAVTNESGTMDPAKLEELGLHLEAMPKTLDELYPDGLAALDG